jgi:hypothetical protein
MLTISHVESSDPDTRDLERCAIIAGLAGALENANRAIEQLASVWPRRMRDAAADVVRTGYDLVRQARDEIQ